MTNNDFQTLPTKWWSSGDHGSDVIPASCCHDVTIDNYLNYNNTDCTVSLNDYHESVCLANFYIVKIKYTFLQNDQFSPGKLASY